MAYSFIASVSAGGGNTLGASTTTGAINTTGANLIIVCCVDNDNGINSSSIVPTDNKGNTYTALTAVGSNANGCMFYCYAPTVGSGHTFTGGVGAYRSLAALAFSGAASSPHDQEAFGVFFSGTPGGAGSITPTANGELIIALLTKLGNQNVDLTYPTIDTGFTIAENVDAGSVGVSSQQGLAVAYLIQGTAGNVAALWTWSSGIAASAVSESFFSLAAAGKNLYPAQPAIPSAAQWPTPVVTGPNTLTAGTASPETPAIPSAAFWGTPFVDLIQTIKAGNASPELPAIPSAANWPSPSVFHSLGIVAGTASPETAAIPSAANWGTPVVVGSPSGINTFGIPSAASWPTPSISGGAIVGVQIFLSGVDVTKYLSWVDNTCRIESQTLGRWTATLDFYDYDQRFVPIIGQTILILDCGARVFAGCIQQIVVDRQLSTVSDITYHITATDKSAICDHRVVVGTTYSATDANGNPVDLATGVILPIVANFLNGEGISTAGVPTDGSLGNLDQDLDWNFPTVTQAFDQIAQDEGLVWWIDANSILYFSPLSTLPAAPFGLTETSYNWRNLTVTTTTTSYYNKLYCVSNLNILPGSASGGSGNAGQTGTIETITFTAGQPNVVLAPNGTPTGFNVSIAAASVISMTVNGNPQTVYDFSSVTSIPTPTGPTDYLWFWVGGYTQFSYTYGVPVGATIVIDYVPGSSSASVAQYGSALKPTDPSGNPLGTCGSGIYEGVLQVQNVTTQAALNATAAAELARIVGIPTVIDYQTDYPGLVPGMLQNVNIPLVGANNINVMITSVSGVFIPPGPFPLTGGSFRWDVEGTTNLDPGNWYKWFERLVGATQNPNPLLRYSQATFNWSGIAVTAGSAVVNPYPVGQTGQFSYLSITCSTPPVGQDLVVTVTDNGVTVYSITFPASGSANQVFTYVPSAKTTPIYFYQGDVLNVNVSYNVTGANPVPAANATVAVRWAS